MPAVGLIVFNAFTPDTCSQDTSCIHLYPRLEDCLELVSVSGVNAALDLLLETVISVLCRYRILTNFY